MKINPFCPSCKVMMRAKERNVITGTNEVTGLPMRGRRKVWECPKCKRRYKRGAEVIRYKPEPKPTCFAVGYKPLKNKKCMECPYAGECSQLYNLQFGKKPTRKPQRLNRQMPIKIKKVAKK